MQKDFQKWHGEKSIIHHDKKRPFFHLREVWFCSLGANVGFEQDGGGERYLRPVLILRKFNNEVLWVLPFTKNKKKGKYYVSVEISGGELSSTVILSQIRLIDAKRLQYKIGDISEEDFLKIKKTLSSAVGITGIKSIALLPPFGGGPKPFVPSVWQTRKLCQ